jgi:dCTP deaminase
LAQRNKKIKRDRLGDSKAGVLTEQDIKNRLKGKPGDVHTLVITPFAKEFDKDSVDLRLGSCFFVPRAHRSPCFIPGITNMLHLYSEQYVPYGSYLVLPAHHTVLGSTLEYIKLPSDVSGQILTKSSWGRTFITIEAAPWIHPLFRGCLTLEIANASNTPIILYPGVKVAQLILLKTTHDTAKDKMDKMEGTYIGPVRPEPAHLPTPEKALGSIGVNQQDIVYPFDECLEHEDFLEHIAQLLRKYGFTVEQKGE